MDFRRTSTRRGTNACHRTSARRQTFIRRWTYALCWTAVGLLPDDKFPPNIGLTPVAGLLPVDGLSSYAGLMPVTELLPVDRLSSDEGLTPVAGLLPVGELWSDIYPTPDLRPSSDFQSPSLVDNRSSNICRLLRSLQLPSPTTALPDLLCEPTANLSWSWDLLQEKRHRSAHQISAKSLYFCIIINTASLFKNSFDTNNSTHFPPIIGQLYQTDQINNKASNEQRRFEIRDTYQLSLLPLSRNLNGLHLSLHLIRLCVLRQSESAEELTAAALDSMPAIAILLLLLLPLAAYLENSAFHDLDLNLLLLDAGEIGLEDMRLRRLLPIDACVGEGRNLVRVIGAWSGEGVVEDGGDALEWVPDVEGEGIEDVAPANDRHLF
ncbi:hypothetical protein M5K25_007303 [Dendrobium thyrsiflorum]|uniref:Uncharacterized protein n=1 Tax=Dendrobium thyrsiflorum TaxID=117978 RepID=A0ABD0VDU6_DENTH